MRKPAPKSLSRRDRLRIGAKLKRLSRAQLGVILQAAGAGEIAVRVPKPFMLVAAARATGARLSKGPAIREH